MMLDLDGLKEILVLVEVSGEKIWNGFRDK
jgi:hypothetical protein